MMSRVDVIQEKWAQRLLTEIEKIDSNAAKIFQSELYLLSQQRKTDSVDRANTSARSDTAEVNDQKLILLFKRHIAKEHHPLKRILNCFRQEFAHEYLPLV